MSSKTLQIKLGIDVKKRKKKRETLEKTDFTVLVLTIRQAVRGRIYDDANSRAVTPEYVFPKRMWEQVDSQWARSFFVYRAARRPQKYVTFFSYLKARA